MAEGTAIAWTDDTFNPWWGCTKVDAPGDEMSECDLCYADTLSIRFGWRDAGGSGPALWGKEAPRRFFGDKHWREPETWERDAITLGEPQLVFCGSMCDVFEPRDDLVEHRVRLFDLIERTPHLIWQLLTKRPEQVLRLVPPRWLGISTDGPDEMVQLGPSHRVPWRYVSSAERRLLAALPAARDAWPTNVWVGTSIGTQRSADLRLPRLLELPAPVRFLSCEPLLEPVHLAPPHPYSVRRLGWVIIGGESGPGWRPMENEWARSLRDQALAAAVPVFFKQRAGHVSGLPGPDDLERHKAFPPQAQREGAIHASRPT